MFATFPVSLSPASPFSFIFFFSVSPFHAFLFPFRILYDYFTFLSFILNYKVVSVLFLLFSSRFYHSLIPFLPTSYFPLLSSRFYPHFFSFMHFTPFPLRSFLPFFCYSMLTFLCPPSQFHLGVPGSIRVYTGESFCSGIEMPCNYEARGKYHLSGDAISSWLIVIALPYYSPGPANELAQHRFYVRFCPDNPSDTTIHKKPKARLAAECQASPLFQSRYMEARKAVARISQECRIMNVLQFCD